MNKKGEISYIGALFGLVGGGLAWWMAGRMGAGFTYKLITFLLTMIACYFIVSVTGGGE